MPMIQRRKKNKNDQFTLANNFLKKCKAFAAKNGNSLQKVRKETCAVNVDNGHVIGDNRIASEIREALNKYYAENEGVKEFVNLQKKDEVQRQRLEQKHTNDTSGSNSNICNIKTTSNEPNESTPISSLNDVTQTSIDVKKEVNANTSSSSINKKQKTMKKSKSALAYNLAKNRSYIINKGGKAIENKHTKMKALDKGIGAGNVKQNNNNSNKSKASVPKKSTKMLTYMCRDMCGKKYDVKQLRDQRYHAVMKGIKFMQKFFRKNKYEALHAIGDDAPSIFFEMWYTSADSRVRSISKSLAIEFTEKLEVTLLKKTDKRIDEFFEAMFLLRIKKEMELDCSALLEMAYEIYVDKDLKDTDTLFEVEKNDLDNVKTGPWLLLLMRILIMEYNKIIFQNKFPIKWGMKEAFTALRCHKLSLAGGENFHDSFFLATHIVYALSAYNATKTLEKDVKWIWRYLRKALKYWLGQARLKEKEIKKAKEEGVDPPPFRYVDIDGIAEVVDVLRGCGLTEASDPMICQATICLLKIQNKVGDWPVYFNHGNGNMKNDKSSSFYDKVHPCWVSVQSLVAKGTFHNETYERWVKNVVRESNFGKLGYNAKWNSSSSKKKKGSNNKKHGTKNVSLDGLVKSKNNTHGGADEKTTAVPSSSIYVVKK
jgi:hypothetical protein